MDYGTKATGCQWLLVQRTKKSPQLGFPSLPGTKIDCGSGITAFGGFRRGSLNPGRFGGGSFGVGRTPNFGSLGCCHD